MTTQTKRPPTKQTVGAQYLCFSKPQEDGAFLMEYEEAVEKTETVKSVKVSENGDSSPIYGSGKIYKSNTMTANTDIEVEVIAFPAETLAKGRGDLITESGLRIGGSNKRNKPYFAYGKVVIHDNNNYSFEWYPKCQISSNSNDASTSEDKASEQNDTITITAMPFNDDGDIFVEANSQIIKKQGLTEDKFFSKPITSEVDFAALFTTPSENGE